MNLLPKDVVDMIRYKYLPLYIYPKQYRNVLYVEDDWVSSLTNLAPAYYDEFIVAQAPCLSHKDTKTMPNSLGHFGWAIEEIYAWFYDRAEFLYNFSSHGWLQKWPPIIATTKFMLLLLMLSSFFCWLLLKLSELWSMFLNNSERFI